FTSLIFGELGSKALSFLGKTGSIIGFTLNMIVYFSTRFASVNFIIEDFRSSSSKIKKKHINNLLLYNLNNIQTETKITTEIIPSDAKDNVSPAVENWLSDLGQTPTDKKRVICIKHISPVLSVTLVAITALPIVWSFIPESVQGLESFTHTNVGHDSGYKNAGSITFGIFATSLTMLFYELNIKELPKHLMITALTIYEKLRNKQIASAVKLFGLTIVALGASYFTGIGFKFAAKTAVTNGYLSYLGDWLSNAVPDFLLTAVTTMLWSHLQDLINQVHVFKTKEYDLTTIESINSKNIMALLYNPKVEITTSLPPSPDDIESGHTQGYQTF
nr:hypothetical protein [Gammaproteobacteria bacterium]